MKPSTAEALTWVLIYGGLLAAALGFAARGGAGHLGYGLMLGGALAASAGFVLIYLRSRMSDTPLNEKPHSKDTKP